jgi:uncharacterized protein (DUF362 family)
MKKKLNRREFLGLAAAMGLSMYAAHYFLTGEEVIASGIKKSVPGSILTYVEGDSAAEMTKKVINNLGGIKKFVSPGDVVVLKPNIAWDRGPGYGANTSPEVVGTIAKLCKDAGAQKVKIIDNPCVEPKLSYLRSGMMEIGKAVGADIHYLDKRNLKELPINGTFIKDWPVYREFLETDKLINIPIAKHHGSTTLSIGMKNWLGAIGGERGSLHKAIHESITDLASFFRPDLTIVDCMKVLVANGPRGGNLSDVKSYQKIAGGTDVVAVDALAASFFGYAPSDINYIQMAYQRGLGQINYKQYLNV